MQQYKRPEAIKRMNELAGSRKPFLFIIDYKQQCLRTLRKIWVQRMKSVL